MDFFDRLAEVFDATGKELTKRAQSFVSTSKIQSQISTEEQKIRDAYQQIGVQYYEKHPYDAEEEFTVWFDQIKASRKALEMLNEQLEILRGLRRCPSCGETVDSQSLFCPKCGSKLPPLPDMDPGASQQDDSEKNGEAQ